MTTLTDTTRQDEGLLISRFQVRVLSGSPMDGIALHPAGFASPVTWALAPEWVTPADAAALLGGNYTTDSIWSLMGVNALVCEVIDGQVMVETESLAELQEALLDIA